MKKPIIKRDLKPDSSFYYLTGKQIIDALEESHAQDQMSDTLAAHFTLLINRIATHRHFSGYSFLDEMKSHATENLVKHWRTFQHRKEGCNPFAYFTSAVRNSFIQVIKIEKRHQDLRNELALIYASDEQLLGMIENLDLSGPVAK